uniref:S-layer protein 2 (Fragments) n=1 Tax=Bacillus thuringiensis subsp. konkukian TaxID=180856 RepID=SLAP2_BACHU|nr:RecName: Full=S-layer protein 2; AltName: Full=55 KDa parasporal endotoxin [[Bacillus thuringiensis] serovar konkukian]
LDTDLQGTMPEVYASERAAFL